ncbi:venom protein 302-like [Gordionus sp. m RMFG-2023]|uniref:venom protein 302-like n=1 Tax=Gordionus sp. m RMFG-2023 TaxID=3053472 RepID=UPI0031FC12E3
MLVTKTLTCVGILLGLFNTIVMALDCPCQQLKIKCKTASPTNCKAEVIKDVCNCCNVCAKVVGEVCGGPFFIKGKCAKGLICIFKSYQEPIQSDGKCVLGFARNVGDPCGDAWQQGACKPGLLCLQSTPANIGKCVFPPNILRKRL